jgi:hypothetical protein
MDHNKNTIITRRDALRCILKTTGVTATLPLMSTLGACTPEVEKQLSPYMALIEEISELIIPETDTPGAKSAGVPAYIQAVIGSHYTDTERAHFIDNLAVFDEMAHAENVESFVSASTDMKHKILRSLDNQNAPSKEHAIWREIRSMVIFGYYTSEAASDDVLYEAVPGKYDGNVDFSEIGRAWMIRGI